MSLVMVVVRALRVVEGESGVGWVCQDILVGAACCSSKLVVLLLEYNMNQYRQLEVVYLSLYKAQESQCLNSAEQTQSSAPAIILLHN